MLITILIINNNLENTNKNDRLNILKQLYIGNFKKIKQKYFYHFFERIEAKFTEISSKINVDTIYEMLKMFRNERFLNKCNKIVIIIAIKNKNV